jgi:hypothetical protein
MSPLRVAAAALLLPAALSPALAQEPAYLAGDRFIYERIERDSAGLETKRLEVVWEVLESTTTGHRIRIVEDPAGAAKETVWIFDRDHNVLAQEAGACRNASEPNAGRYRWPMSNDSAWSAVYDVVQHCPGESPKRQGRCEVQAKVVWQGTYDALQAPAPAIAIERVVTCVGPTGSALDGAAVRWEKELLCPTLGVRCAYEYDWVVFGPGQATPTVLSAFRDLPEAQTWGGRVGETLQGLELR